MEEKNPAPQGSRGAHDKEAPEPDAALITACPTCVEFFPDESYARAGICGWCGADLVPLTELTREATP